MARIGDSFISLEEFELTYQFNPYLSQIQDIQQAKRIHLQTLIAEKMIALEGYRQSYENKPQIKALREQLKREALIEKLWQDEIQKNITVSEREVYDAYLKSKRTRIFKYLIFPDRQIVQRAYLHMKNGISFSEVAQMNGIDPNLIPEDSVSFGSDLNALESYVFQLNLNEVGKPIKIGQYFFLIKHLDEKIDIFTSADDFKRQYRRIEKIIRKRQQSVFYQKYIKNKFDKPPYRLNKQVFKILVQKLEDLFNISTFDKQSNIRENTNYILGKAPDQLGQFLETPVVGFRGEIQWTVKTLLTRLQISPYPVIVETPGKFRSSMIAATRMILDDEVLVSLALNADLENTAYVRSQSQMWEDYLVFQEVLKNLGLTISPTDSNDALNPAFNLGTKIDEYLMNLTDKYDLTIYKSVFDTLAPGKSDMVVTKTHFPQRTIAPVIIPLNYVPRFQNYISSKLFQN